MNILITGARSFVAYELMKGFSTSGANVYIADSLDMYLCKSFPYYKKSFTIKSCNADLDGFTLDLQKIISEFKIDVLIPTCEEIFFISMIKDKLSTTIMTSDISLLKNLHDKYIFTTIFKYAAKTKLLSEYNDDFSSFVVKKRFSRFGNNVFINKIPKTENLSDFIIQEYIKGRELCSYSYAINGECKFHVFYYKTSGKHVSTIFEPFYDEKLAKIIEDFVKETNYTGNISFDVIKKDDEYYFIECNPRITSGIHCLSHLSFDKLFFGKTEITYKKKALALANFFYNPMQGYLKKIDIFSGEKHALKIQVKNLINMKKIAKKNKISLLDAMTFDIEWNGEDI